MARIPDSVLQSSDIVQTCNLQEGLSRLSFFVDVILPYSDFSSFFHAVHWHALSSDQQRDSDRVFTTTSQPPNTSQVSNPPSHPLTTTPKDIPNTISNSLTPLRHLTQRKNKRQTQRPGESGFIVVYKWFILPLLAASGREDHLMADPRAPHLEMLALWYVWLIH